MNIIRGTTPTIIITVKNMNVDLTRIKTASVKWSQNGRTKIDKKLSDLVIDDTQKTIKTRLTSKETMSLVDGDADFQIGVRMDDNATELQTKKYKVDVYPTTIGTI